MIGANSVQRLQEFHNVSEQQAIVSTMSGWVPLIQLQRCARSWEWLSGDLHALQPLMKPGLPMLTNTGVLPLPLVYIASPVFIWYVCVCVPRQLDGLPELLSSSDFVCNVLPSTAQTRGLLDGDILRHCASKVDPYSPGCSNTHLRWTMARREV